MSRETTEARRLTLAAQEALAAAFPDTSFTVETGHIKTTKDPEEPILRGEIEWVNGPPVSYVQDVVRELHIPGNWKLVCYRWYSPAWATAMAQHHGAHVKISTCGFNREAALLHPHAPTPEAEEALRTFRSTLDYCMAPRRTT